MTMGARTVKGDRPAAYPDKAQLAAELSMSESTVDEMVRRGVLPKPLRLSTGCIRWRWTDVEAALARLAAPADDSPADPYMAGVRNVAKATMEGRRGTA
jgi:predicted DNA-binding transcriptional regulator AlpA